VRKYESVEQDQDGAHGEADRECPQQRAAGIARQWLPRQPR